MKTGKTVSSENFSLELSESPESGEETPRKKKGGRPRKPQVPEGTLPYITGEEVKALRVALGLSTSQFSQLVRVAHSTVRQHWEVKGVFNRGGDTYSLFNMLCAMASAATTNPEFLSPRELLDMIEETLNYTLGNRFMQYKEHASESFIAAINSGDFAGVVLATLFINYLRKERIINSTTGGLIPMFDVTEVSKAFIDARKKST